MEQNRLVSRVREQQRLQPPAARVLRPQRRELLHNAHIVFGALAVEFRRAEHQRAVERKPLWRERFEQTHLRADCSREWRTRMPVTCSRMVQQRVQVLVCSRIRNGYVTNKLTRRVIVNLLYNTVSEIRLFTSVYERENSLW